MAVTGLQVKSIAIAKQQELGREDGDAGWSSSDGVSLALHCFSAIVFVLLKRFPGQER